MHTYIHTFIYVCIYVWVGVGVYVCILLSVISVFPCLLSLKVSLQKHLLQQAAEFCHVFTYAGFLDSMVTNNIELHTLHSSHQRL